MEQSIIKRFCYVCEEDCDFQLKIIRDFHVLRGDKFNMDIPSLVCSICGNKQPDPDTDDVRMIYDEYRHRHHMLMPDEIKQIKEQSGLSHEAFAEWLRINPETLSRFEEGALQDEFTDAMLKLRKIASQKPQIIYICGSIHSSHIIEKMDILSWELERQGNIVLKTHICPSSYSDNNHDVLKSNQYECSKSITDELYKRKIEMADKVFIVNVGGYIGESTQKEISYSQQLGKPIEYLEKLI